MPSPTVLPLSNPDVLLITPVRHVDQRGYFSEVYNRDLFRDLGIAAEFIQDNQSLSREVGVVRGLHFQAPPFAQAKLVRVLKGAILDVVVDIRRGSPRYGESVAARLDATEGAQLYVPAGFAHGFCTLEPETEILYKVSAPYAPEHDRGLLWNDPDLAIDWPVSPEAAVLSARDRRHPRLKDLPAYFD